MLPSQLSLPVLYIDSGPRAHRKEGIALIGISTYGQAVKEGHKKVLRWEKLRHGHYISGCDLKKNRLFRLPFLRPFRSYYQCLCLPSKCCVLRSEPCSPPCSRAVPTRPFTATSTACTLKATETCMPATSRTVRALRTPSAYHPVSDHSRLPVGA